MKNAISEHQKSSISKQLGLRGFPWLGRHFLLVQANTRGPKTFVKKSPALLQESFKIAWAIKSSMPASVRMKIS